MLFLLFQNFLAERRQIKWKPKKFMKESVQNTSNGAKHCENTCLVCVLLVGRMLRKLEKKNRHFRSVKHLNKRRTRFFWFLIYFFLLFNWFFRFFQQSVSDFFSALPLRYFSKIARRRLLLPCQHCGGELCIIQNSNVCSFPRTFVLLFFVFWKKKYFDVFIMLMAVIAI